MSDHSDFDHVGLYVALRQAIAVIAASKNPRGEIIIDPEILDKFKGMPQSYFENYAVHCLPNNLVKAISNIPEDVEHFIWASYGGNIYYFRKFLHTTDNLESHSWLMCVNPGE